MFCLHSQVKISNSVLVSALMTELESDAPASQVLFCQSKIIVTMMELELKTVSGHMLAVVSQEKF
jgi:hypothetical protein